MGTKPERITHAVVLTAERGWPVLGKSHADCFMKGDATGLRMSSRAMDQGFMTSKGKFATRSDAYFLAFWAGQIDEDPGGILFSEMLWSPKSGGRQSYSEVFGYLPATMGEVIDGAE